MSAAPILIVEDEAIVAMDLKGELEAAGYAVVGIADTAEQAVAQAQVLRPALVLMDIMLNGSGDGIDAAEAMRRSGENVPVIFLTSFSDPDTVARAARTSAYGYLTKPFQPKELRAGIEVALWKARLECQLREADRWFAATLRCVQDGIVAVDADGRVKFINSAAEALTGCDAADALGRPVGDVVRLAAPVEAEAPAAAPAAHVPGAAAPPLVLRALELGRVVGVRHAQRLLRPGAEPVLVDESAGPVCDDHGRLLGAVLVLRDASERIRQEALLRDSEARFRSAFEAAPLGMAMVSLSGRFLQVNDALCRLLHCTPLWLLDRSQAGLTDPEDARHEETRLAELRTLSQPVTQFEKRYLRAPDGAPVWVLVSASLLSANGEPACYLYQVHDLTAHKLAAAQLAELAAERIRREAAELAGRSSGEFLSRVSHEMRTPLNAVIGFAQLLKFQHAAGEVIDAAYSAHILHAGEHLLALVDDVLDAQRAGDGTLRLTMAAVPLADVLPAAVDLLLPLARERGVRFELQLEPGLCVRADATRLRQVVLNVGSNAVKYNTEGGSVRVEAALRAGARVRITVVDSGIGMSAQQLQHLFEPFNRLGREALRIPGVGLGLVITRKLVEQMGGTVAVGPAAPRGTVVTLDFAQAAPGQAG